MISQKNTRNKKVGKHMVSFKKTFFSFIFLLLSTGCSIDRQESNQLFFNIESTQDLADLNVNLYLYKNNFNSKWYDLVKKETIIQKGKLLKKSAIDSNIFYYDLYIYNSNFKKVHTTENIIKNSIVDHYYSFSAEYFKFNILKNKEIFSSGTLNYKSFKESSINKFIYYDPNAARFELTELSEDSLNILNSMTFEELLGTDKLLNKDIMKLRNLSLTQKKKLIEIHNLKKN